MISVLILTFNEEQNLPRCLDSVSWSEDVLVVDSFSADRTVEIAKAHGARVRSRRFDDFAGQRNFGLEHGGLKEEWVLHLDADEVVTARLQEELTATAARAACDGYRLASKMMFRERWLKHAGMYPAYQVRFGRRDVLRFKMVGHGQRETLPADRVGTLTEPLLHYSFSKGLDDWHTRHEAYAAAEAAENLAILSRGCTSWRGLLAADATERRRAVKELSVRLPFRPAWRFFYMYALRRGFLDGTPGWQYCRMLSWYEGRIVAKLKALRGQTSVAAAANNSGRKHDD